MEQITNDLTAVQILPNGLSKYAIFLPATSGFYSTFIGKQRFGHYVDLARIPGSFVNSVESLNYLDPNKGLFNYKWALYSAGHANLDLNTFDESEDMFRNRDRSTSLVVADSGGFQIGKFCWTGEWRDPTSKQVKNKMADCIARGIESVPVLDPYGNPIYNAKGRPKITKINHVKRYQAQLDAAEKKRYQVLTWMDALMDWGMGLDIPAWCTRVPGSAEAIGVSSYQEAMEATKYNNNYFINNRNGNCKFLNVLQGENHADAFNWYSNMKDFCDPKIYGDRAFNGWAMGGQLMCSPTLVLKMIIKIIDDGLLKSEQQDWMHFLGTSKLEWAVFLTDIQNAIRKYHNPTLSISFDCASPFLSTANGQIYTNVELEDRKKWVYRMIASADDKKYATDSRLFKDVVIQDGIFKQFTPSPVIDQLAISDICIYKPGDLNKNGKEGKTSWDSFSYAIQMGHNVWAHINAVQQANMVYESKQSCPAMMVDERHSRQYMSDLVDLIFSVPAKDALEIIDYYDSFISRVIGTRGQVGKREVNASTYFDSLFDFANEDAVQCTQDEDFTTFYETEKLTQLEDELKHDNA